MPSKRNNSTPVGADSVRTMPTSQARAFSSDASGSTSPLASPTSMNSPSPTQDRGTSYFGSIIGGHKPQSRSLSDGSIRAIFSPRSKSPFRTSRGEDQQPGPAPNTLVSPTSSSPPISPTSAMAGRETGRGVDGTKRMSSETFYRGQFKNQVLLPWFSVGKTFGSGKDEPRAS